MLKKRLIPVLILRDGRVVQSVQFKHTNVIHWKPVTAIDFFNRWAVDEIILLDVSKDLNSRDKFMEVFHGLTKKCFVPLTVGGWITDIEQARNLIQMGADKIVLNTQAFENKPLVTQCAELIGSQCVVASIDVKRHEDESYEVYIDRGSKPTGVSPFEWAKEVEGLGAGEIFLNCINNDGFRQGYDLNLMKGVSEVVNIPVIAMGGVLTWQHLVDGVVIGQAEAVAAANIFHYTEHATKKAKAFMREQGLNVR